MSSSRRIAAIVLPNLLCELASSEAPEPKQKPQPYGVVLVQSEEEKTHLGEERRLEAVDLQARKLGLRAGLTIAEAHAFVSGLVVRRVELSQVQKALERVAEVALAFAPTVSLCSPDTVFLDLTGSAHLAGGEDCLAVELRARVGRLGHVARVAIADGPRIAEAVARHGADIVTVVPGKMGAKYLRPLPVSALPLDPEVSAWLLRLGVVTVGDLVRLPREQLSSRLGPRTPEVLTLLGGQDPSPLQAYQPPSILSEEAFWDDGVQEQSAIVFVLKRLTARLAARLEGRGEAVQSLAMTLSYDRSIAELRGAEPSLRLQLELPSPLSHGEDLLRTLRAKLESCQLEAPALGVRLEALQVVPAPRVQLDLSRETTVSPDELPVLLAELTAELGASRVGVFHLSDSHRPEAQAKLRPVTFRAGRAVSMPSQLSLSLGTAATRLLRIPVCLGKGPIEQGQLLMSEPIRDLEVRQIEFEARLSGVEWWTPTPTHRDYMRVWVRTGQTGGTAWLYVDKKTQKIYLHGWLD